jgi:hypothetical protein
MGAMLNMVLQIMRENLRELDVIIGSGTLVYSIILSKELNCKASMISAGANDSESESEED